MALLLWAMGLAKYGTVEREIKIIIIMLLKSFLIHVRKLLGGLNIRKRIGKM